MFLKVRVVPGTCRHEADSELPATWQPSSWERTLLAPVTNDRQTHRLRTVTRRGRWSLLSRSCLRVWWNGRHAALRSLCPIRACWFESSYAHVCKVERIAGSSCEHLRQRRKLPAKRLNPGWERGESSRWYLLATPVSPSSPMAEASHLGCEGSRFKSEVGHWSSHSIVSPKARTKELWPRR